MATQNSTLVSNFEGKTLNAVQELHGRVRVAQGTVAVAADGTGTGDIIMLAPIPSNASIISIKLAADDLDSDGSPALAWDVGLYDADGVVADVDAYATAVTLGQAATVFTEYAFEARNINACGQKVYEDAGASTDPNAYYYVAASIQTAAATGAAGDLSFIIEYVVD